METCLQHTETNTICQMVPLLALGPQQRKRLVAEITHVYV